MRLVVEMTDQDIKNWKGLYAWSKGKKGAGYFVDVRKQIDIRYERYKNRGKIFDNVEEFRKVLWRALVMGIGSSQQNMKAGKPAPKFIGACSGMEVEAFNGMKQSDFYKIEGAKSIRLRKTIYKNLIEAAAEIIDEGVEKFMEELENLVSDNDPRTTLFNERRSANFLRKCFKGVGFKQSRNMLVIMGLAKYTIPLDSRVQGALLKMGLQMEVGSRALQDEGVYLAFENMINSLCRELGILPYEFDAFCYYGEEGVDKYVETHELA